MRDPINIIDEQPILILDIKLSRDTPQKLTIYEGDNPETVVDRFSLKNCKYFFNLTKVEIDETKRQRLLEVIRTQIAEYYEDVEESSQEQMPLSQINEAEERSYNSNSLVNSTYNK